MIGTRFRKLANRKLLKLEVDDFSGGSNNLVSETRLKPNEAKESLNMILAEDGVWKKRWGSAAYGGVTWTNLPDGFKEYRKSDGTRELIVVADGKVWVVDPAAGTKTEISGATFAQGYPCDFVQSGGDMYICNGQDDLAKYNGTSLSTYSSIDAPAWDGTPLVRGAGLSAGTFTYYYRVSAVNGVGETLAAAEQSITVDIERDLWDEADEYIQLDWADVAGALKYIIYFGDTTGYINKLTETEVSTFQDDATYSPNPYIEPPTADTTDGPKFRSIAVSGNRIWGTSDPVAPQRVYFTGTGVNRGNFATGYGGGWLDLETGGRSTTVSITDYQDKPHVLCETAEGTGAIWRISLDSVTIAGTSVTVPVPTKLIAVKGTPARRSVVLVENDLYFTNERGEHVLGDEVGVLNRLRTNELSASIRPYMRDLDQASLNKVCAYYYDSKVFISVPTSTGDPNRIILYDRELKAWIKDWSIGVSQFGEFTDASGLTHFLGISGTGLVEFSENFESDSGVAFTWRYVSPRFSVDKDWTKFARIKRMYVRLKSAKGSVDFSVLGTTRSGATSTLASDTISPGSSNTGIGWDLIGSVRIGTTGGTPTTFAAQSLPRYIQIDELLREVQWEISGDGVSDSATITGLRAEGNLVSVASPEAWRLD